MKEFHITNPLKQSHPKIFSHFLRISHKNSHQNSQNKFFTSNFMRNFFFIRIFPIFFSHHEIYLNSPQLDWTPPPPHLTNTFHSNILTIIEVFLNKLIFKVLEKIFRVYCLTLEIQLITEMENFYKSKFLRKFWNQNLFQLLRSNSGKFSFWRFWQFLSESGNVTSDFWWNQKYHLIFV